MRMEQMYQDVILDHYKHPHGRGLREPFGAEVHHVNPTCGDEVTLRVRLADGVLSDLSYDALGCSISIAGASVAADELTGVDVATAMERYDRVLAVVQGRVEADPEVDGDVAAFAGVRRFPARVRCALLGWAAARDALLRASTSGKVVVGTGADTGEDVDKTESASEETR